MSEPEPGIDTTPTIYSEHPFQQNTNLGILWCRCGLTKMHPIHGGPDTTPATRYHQEKPMSAAAAFAAVEAIMSGEWDRYLHRIRGACMLRAQTDEYQATLIAGDPNG